MNMIRLCRGAILSLSLMALSQANADPSPKPTPRHTVISAINSSSITVDIGSTSRQYKINERTLFTYNGMSVSLEDIKPGMRVTVTPAFDNRVASLVAAGFAPAAPKK